MAWIPAYITVPNLLSMMSMGTTRKCEFKRRTPPPTLPPFKLNLTTLFYPYFLAKWNKICFFFHWPLSFQWQLSRLNRYFLEINLQNSKKLLKMSYICLILYTNHRHLLAFFKIKNDGVNLNRFRFSRKLLSFATKNLRKLLKF
jgi:hypothetical protein